MKRSTVIASVIIHGGLAIALFGAAQKRVHGKTVFVQMAEEARKKPKPVEKEAKKVPPKPKLAPPPTKVATAAPAHTAPVRAAPVQAAPVATAIEMSNDEPVGAGDIVIPVAKAAAVAPVKVASMDDGPRRRRIRETGGTAGPGGPSIPGDITCHEDPTKPEPVYKKDIEYTASARAEGIEGKLKLKLTVGADGQVINVEVLSAVAPELDAAAVAAVRLWRFKPAMLCGKAVSGGVYIVARRFELGD
ncbi:MAG TPA: energy transducer TonB [Polyangia bacterium]